MPWKNKDAAVERHEFVKAVVEGEEVMGAVCRRFGISRVTGYKWLKRFEAGGLLGMADRSHRPHAPRGPKQVQVKWVGVAMALRQQRPTWGVRKLHDALRREHPHAELPSVSTLWRRLRAEGLLRAPRPQRRKGPILPRAASVEVRRANDLWTMDFKGHFRVGSGETCRPLTVRDAFSRYLLAIEHVRVPNDEMVRAVLERIFRCHGLPKAILVDNGTPFAGVGALGLSRLSVWWERLGIAVHFTRRGKPQDNGAHEQMHRVLKAETARPPARTLRAQQQRLARWRHDYNSQRPHEALAGRVPAELYRPSPRRWHVPVELQYGRRWGRIRVQKNGYANWQGRVVLIGRAFAGEWIGLRPVRPGSADSREVYFGTKLIGELDPAPAREMRPAQYDGTPRRTSRKGWKQ